MIDFKLPEIGENIEQGTVVTLHVSAGDAVKQDQALIELETDKATIEVPSPADGTIREILIKEGDTVSVGQVILKIDGKAAASAEPAASPKEEPVKTKPKTKAAPAQAASASPEPQKNLEDINLVVVGGGPGGYAAAFLAADLGMKVTVIDKEKNPGGVCVYRGCIPSKALLHVAKMLAETKDAKDLGIDFGTPKIDINKVRAWKESVIAKLSGGAGQLANMRKVKWIEGLAQFKDSKTLKIKLNKGGEEELSFDYAIIATGSYPIKLPFAPDSENVLDSTSALDLKEIPKKLLVVGGGYIGLELGTVYHELGSKVSVVEMMAGLLPGCDRDLANVLSGRVSKRFESIQLETKVTAMEETKKGIKVSFEDKGGKSSSEEFDKVLVSIGRKPNSANLGLENTGVVINSRGFVEVNAQLKTAEDKIYAIGDVATEPMLAHKASHEGRVAVEAIAGHKVAFEPNAIPAVVFTDPEIAWCGLTETEAKEQGRAIKVVKFPWGASGRAITLNRTDGLTKLIIDPDSELILGMGIAGVGAGELISEGVVAVEMGAVAADLKLSIHPHPTISETIMESAESFFGQSTHIYKKK